MLASEFRFLYKIVVSLLTVVAVHYISIAQNNSYDFEIEPSIFEVEGVLASQWQNHFYDKEGFLWFVNPSGCIRCLDYECYKVYNPYRFMEKRKHPSLEAKFHMNDSLLHYGYNENNHYFLNILDRSTDSIVYRNQLSDAYCSPQCVSFNGDDTVLLIDTILQNDIIYIEFINIKKGKENKIVARDSLDHRIPFKELPIKTVVEEDQIMLFYHNSILVFNSLGVLLDELNTTSPLISAHGYCFDVYDENIFYVDLNNLLQYNLNSNLTDTLFDLSHDYNSVYRGVIINAFDDIIFGTSIDRDFIYSRKNHALEELTEYFDLQFAEYEGTYSKKRPISEISKLNDDHYLLTRGEKNYTLKIESNYKAQEKAFKLNGKSIRGMCLDNHDMLLISYYSNLGLIDPSDPLVKEKNFFSAEVNYLKQTNPYHLTLFDNTLISSTSILSPDRESSVIPDQIINNHAAHIELDDTLHIYPWGAGHAYHYVNKDDVSVSFIDSSLLNQEISDAIYDSINFGFWVLPLNLGPYLIDRGAGGIVFKLDSLLDISKQEYYDLEFHNSSLYIGTYNAILEIKLKDLSTSLHHFPENFDVQPRSVYSISAIGTDTLVLGTSHGIFGFDTNSEQYLIHSDSEYFKKYEFNRASNILVDSTLFLGSTTGLHCININDLEWDLIEEKRDSIFLFGAIFPNDTFYFLDHTPNQPLTIQTKNSTFDLIIGVPDYLKNYTYSWKIDRNDRAWSTKKKENILGIKDIPFGKSKLLVQASFEDLPNLSLTRSITLERKKPFYLTLWFLLLCIIFIFSLMILIYKSIRNYADEVNKKIDRIKTIERLGRHDYINYLEGIKAELQHKQTLDPKTFRSIILKLNGNILTKEVESSRIALSAFNVYPLVRKIIDLYNQLYPNKVISIKGSKHVIIHSNKNIVDMILENLISNIYKHGDLPCEISISQNQRTISLYTTQILSIEKINDINLILEYPKPLQKSKSGLELSSLLAKQIKLDIKFHPHDQKGYDISLKY